MSSCSLRSPSRSGSCSTWPPRRRANPLWLALGLCVALFGCAEGGYTIGGPAPAPRDSTSRPTPGYPTSPYPGEPDPGEPDGDADWDGYVEESTGRDAAPAPSDGWSSNRPLTASGALGQGDAAREASMRLVIAGLDEDESDRPSRALASYQRAVRLDSTNPFAYLALARHHLEYGSPEEASAFLDQARAGFEAEGRLGPAVDVWGLGLRAWIDRGRGQDEIADRRFREARALAPAIWADELLSAGELR